MAVGRPAQDTPPVEVLEDRHDELAARPRRVPERGRRQGPGLGERRRAFLQLGVGRGGVGEVVVETDDPAAGLESADAFRRTVRGAGGLGERRRSEDVKRGDKPIHRCQERG